MTGGKPENLGSMHTERYKDVVEDSAMAHEQAVQENVLREEKRLGGFLKHSASSVEKKVLANKVEIPVDQIPPEVLKLFNEFKETNPFHTGAKKPGNIFYVMRRK